MLTQYKKDALHARDILAYEDQIILHKHIQLHLLSYAMNHPKEWRIGQPAGQPILMREDGGHFQALDFAVVDEKPAQTISNGLIDWQENMLAFYLIKNLPLPNRMCVFMPINHLHRHWTALNVEFEIDDDFVAWFDEIRMAYSTVDNPRYTDEFKVNYYDINFAKNFIKSQVGTEQPFPFGSVTIEHKDSINSQAYDQAVLSKLQLFRVLYPQLQYSFEEVPTQKGNTCCECTVANGISTGLYQHYLVEFDSVRARELTDLIHYSQENRDNAGREPNQEFNQRLFELFHEVNPFVRTFEPQKNQNRLK